MKVRIKKLREDAVIPKYATRNDACVDLVATSKEWNQESEALVFGTGLAVEIPEGHVGLLFPRSSVFKTGLSLANCVGIIDAGYRGEIKAIFYPGNRPKQNYEVGERCCQLMIIERPEIEFEEVQELAPAVRGAKGFGSTGK